MGRPKPSSAAAVSLGFAKCMKIRNGISRNSVQAFQIRSSRPKDLLTRRSELQIALDETARRRVCISDVKTPPNFLVDRRLRDRKFTRRCGDRREEKSKWFDRRSFFPLVNTTISSLRVLRASA